MVEITARHVDITVDLQDYARDKAEGLEADFPRVEFVHVILDQQKHLFIAEVVVQGKNHIRIEASEKADNILAAVDKAFEKAERQLRKERDKITDHKVEKIINQI